MKNLVSTRRRLVVVAMVCTAAVAAFASIAWAGVRGPASGAVGDVWNAGGFGDTDITAPAGVDLGTLVLPKGSFLISAKVSVHNTATGAQWECHVYDPSGTLDEAIDKTGAAFEMTQLPLQAVVSYTVPTNVTLRCSGLNAANSFARQWHVDALRVGKVH